MNKEKKDISDEKTAASSYILTFYQEVQNLTNLFGDYKNVLDKYKHQYGSSVEAKLNDNDKAFLDQKVQQVKIYSSVIYIKYKTFVETIKGTKEDKKLVEAYNGISKTYIIKIEDLEVYVFRLNVLLAQKIMKGLLETSQDLVDDVFQE